MNAQPGQPRAASAAPRDPQSASATVRLHPLLSGRIELRLSGPRRPRRGPLKLARSLAGTIRNQPSWRPVPVFGVEHPAAGPLLIDTGYDPSVASDPVRTLGFVFGRVAMRHRPAERTVRELVAERDVDPDAVSTIVFTHLHLDHASGSSEWPRATFVVDAVEHRRAFSWLPVGPYVRRHLATIPRWRQIDYGREAKPWEQFSRTVDLLGDGSVRLISTPGHSPGHQSVLLRLRDRYALILGDAAITDAELREPVIDGLIMDQDSYVASLEELRAFLRARPDTLTIASHDGDRWEGLEPVYE